MVVQEGCAPMEVSVTERNQKYVVVKNHVRELLPEDSSSVLLKSDSQVNDKINSVKRKGLKRKKESLKQLFSTSQPTDISASDLEELKTIYHKCKAVLQKIESKYGHLLNLNDNEPGESSNASNEEPSCDYCSCSQKKKIVFDENGQQIEKDCIENHICLKRLKRSNSDSQRQKTSIQIEYDDVSTTLPNNLNELVDILKDPSIAKTYRRMVIDKAYLLRQEYLNEIRFVKHDIIKQLKDNPDEVLDFKGTNLSSLHGYPIKPVEYE